MRQKARISNPQRGRELPSSYVQTSSYLAPEKARISNPLHRRYAHEPICYLAALMSKKFTKRKKPAAAPAAVTPEQKLLARQRFLAARALRKRRQRKSHQ